MLDGSANSSKIKVSYLVRKTQVVARKIAVQDLETCIKYEMEGYSENNDIPLYRRVRGTVKAWNRYHGWQRVKFPVLMCSPLRCLPNSSTARTAYSDTGRIFRFWNCGCGRISAVHACPSFSLKLLIMRFKSRKMMEVSADGKRGNALLIVGSPLLRH